MTKTQTRLGLSLLAVVGLMLFGILCLPTSASANPTPTTAAPTEVMSYSSLMIALDNDTVTEVSIISNIDGFSSSGLTIPNNKTVTVQSPNMLRTGVRSTERIVVEAAGTLTVAEGATLHVDSELYNNGTLNIAGTFTGTGTFENYGVVNITVRDEAALLEALTLPGTVNITIPTDWGVIVNADLTIPTDKTVTVLQGSALILDKMSPEAPTPNLTIATGGSLINQGDVVLRGAVDNQGTFQNTATGTVHYVVSTNGWSLNGVALTDAAVTVPYNGAAPTNYTFNGSVPDFPEIFGGAFSFDETTTQYVQFATASGVVSSITASVDAYRVALFIESTYGDGSLLIVSDSTIDATVEKVALQYAYELPDSITVDYTGMASHQQAFPLTITGGVAAGDEVLLEVFGTATFPNANFGSYDNVALTLDSTLSLTGAAAQNYTVSAPTQTTFTVKGTINTPKALPNDSVNGYVVAQPEGIATMQQIAEGGVQAYYDSLVSIYGATFTSVYPTADSMIKAIEQTLPQGHQYRLFDLTAAQTEPMVDDNGNEYVRLMVPAMGGVTADIYGSLAHVDPMTGKVDSYKQVSANTVPQLGEFRVIEGIGIEVVVSHTSPLAISYNPSSTSGTVSGGTTSTTTPLVGPDTGDNSMTGMLLILLGVSALGAILVVRYVKRTK